MPRLYEDHLGVVHWTYLTAGVLYVCGSPVLQGPPPSLQRRDVPTCIQCIAIKLRQEAFLDED